jgi:hypothetical protein
MSIHLEGAGFPIQCDRYPRGGKDEFVIAQLAGTIRRPSLRGTSQDGPAEANPWSLGRSNPCATLIRKGDSAECQNAREVARTSLEFRLQFRDIDWFSSAVRKSSASSGEGSRWSSILSVEV